MRDTFTALGEARNDLEIFSSSRHPDRASQARCLEDDVDRWPVCQRWRWPGFVDDALKCGLSPMSRLPRPLNPTRPFLRRSPDRNTKLMASRRSRGDKLSHVVVAGLRDPEMGNQRKKKKVVTLPNPSPRKGVKCQREQVQIGQQPRIR